LDPWRKSIEIEAPISKIDSLSWLVVCGIGTSSRPAKSGKG
jgi:hypothetical protein